MTRSTTTLAAQESLPTRRCASGHPSSTKPLSGRDATPSQISPQRSMAPARRTYACPPGLRFTVPLPILPCARPTDGAPRVRRFHGLSGQLTRISPCGSKRHLCRCSPPAMSLPCRDLSMSFWRHTEGDCARGFINGRRPNGELPPPRCRDASARRLRLASAPLLWIGNVAALQASELS